MKGLGKVKAKHSHKWVHKATTASVTFDPALADKDGYVVGADEKKEIEYRCSNIVKAPKSPLSETMRRSGMNYLPHTKGEACIEALKVVYEDDLLTEIHFEGDVINDTKTIEVWRKAGW